MSMWSGSLVAIVTPFTNEDRVDFEMLDKLVQMHIDAGTSAIVACGTTGESPTLTHEEEVEIFTRVVAKAKGSQTKVVAGTGSNNTSTAVTMTKRAKEIGVDGCLIVTPYYNKPNVDGLRAHFGALNEVGVPLILYNIPGRTGINVAPQTVYEFSKEFSNITALKASNGNLDEILSTSAMTKDLSLDILSGDDSLTLPIMAVGGRGVVSVVANIMPKVMVQLVDSYTAGKHERALSIAQTIHRFCQMTLATAPNPVPVKALMNEFGLKVGAPRLPLVRCQDGQIADLKKELNEVITALEAGGFEVDAHLRH